MIKRKGVGGHTVLLVERHSEFIKILSEQGENVFSAGTEKQGDDVYYRVVLEQDVKMFYTTQSDLQQYNGQEIRVLRPLSDNECDKADVGEMFKIQFKDGNVIDAFSDEIIEL